MSNISTPKQCINQCGSVIYFDAYSKAGHPTTDKWLPLEYKEGRKTDTIHNCPKKQKQNGLVTAVATATTSKINTNTKQALLQRLKDIEHSVNELTAFIEGSEM